MKGRTATPAEIREAKGNPSRRPVRTASLAELPALGAEAPVELGEAAQAIWEKIAPELARMKLLRETDAGAFARYCDLLARYWAISGSLAHGEETYETDSAHGKMLRTRPELTQMILLARRLEGLEDRFGLSPAARQAILMRLAALPPELPGPLGEHARRQQVDSPLGVLRGTSAVN